MREILIKNVTIVNPKSTFNNQKVNMLIEGGIIKTISNETIVSQNDTQVFDAEGAFLSKGFVDMLGYCSDPGEEWKEDLSTYSAAAAAGGFTHATVLSGSSPLPYTATAIRQTVSFTSNIPVKLLPLGMPSVKGDAHEMSEMYDMIQNGAVGFYNGDIPIEDLGLIQRILEYLSTGTATLYFYPYMRSLAIGGMMNEGDIHVKLGVKGIPEISETTALNAAIAIAKWLNCKLHITRISTAESANIAKQHHSDKITFSVPVMNLLYTDEALLNFDENFKVLPPLRDQKDRDALLQGVINGSIAAVISNHQPQDIEAKQVEFEYSAFGASTLQHTFNALCAALGNNCNEILIERTLSAHPRNILGLDAGAIEPGTAADFTIFSLDKTTHVSKTTNKSKAINDPFMGQTLRGKVMATVLGSQIAVTD